MGWRKLGDDGQELSRLLDYLLDGMKTLKSSVELGRRLDGEGEMKVDSKELWCSGLYRHRGGKNKHPTLKDAKIALRQMKDAKSLLSSISKSLDEAIQLVANRSSKSCRAIGLSLLPDDVLTCIFELYVEMSVLSEGYVDPDTSPQILASVSKRFRQVALASSGLWKHISFRFPRKRVLLHKERCPNPVIQIHTARELSPVEMDKFHIYPYQQWRGLHFAYNDKNEGHCYFQHLKTIIQTPLNALENLFICNDNLLDDDGNWTRYSIKLDDDDLRTLSSWQMPNLTHLDLRNVVPTVPLQCGNITSFSFHVFNYGEETEILNMDAFHGLLQSMPRMQSLHIAFLNVVGTSNNPPSIPIELPSLRSLKLDIGGTTSDLVVIRVMRILVTKEVTHLAIKLFPFNSDEESAFEDWVLAVFDYRPSSSDGGHVPFGKVEYFSLEVESFQGSGEAFRQIFSALPNVKTVSLLLPGKTNLSFAKATEEAGVFRRLRFLHIKVLETYPDDFRDHLYSLDRFFQNGHCKELEKVEIEFRRTAYAAEARARLQKTLGEKLCMIEQ